MTDAKKIVEGQYPENCGACACFVWNGTRYGGVCNNIASALFNRTLSCLRDACGAHSVLRARQEKNDD